MDGENYNLRFLLNGINQDLRIAVRDLEKIRNSGAYDAMVRHDLDLYERCNCL